MGGKVAEKEKEAVKPKRSISLAKLAELEKARSEAMAKRKQEKEDKKKM